LGFAELTIVPLPGKTPSERELEVFFETAPFGLHWVAADGTVLRVNRAELEMLGYSEDEYIGHNIREFHTNVGVVADMLKRLIRGDVLRDYAAQMRHKDGSIRDVLIDSSGYWEDGEFIHTQCFTRDVTELKKAAEVRSRLAAIVESTDDAIVGKTLTGIVTSWNRAAERIFGYLAEEMIGQPITKIIPQSRLMEETYILSRLQRGERIDHYETVRVAKDGTMIDVELTTSPIRDTSGEIVGASKIARDITRRKATDAALQETKAHLARMNEELERRVAERTAEVEAATKKLLQEMQRQKVLEETVREAHKMESLGALAAGIAHEFNNVLNIIMGYTSRTAQESRDPGVTQSLDIIQEAANRGAAIVQELLTIGRKTEAQLEPTDLNEFLKHHAVFLEGSFPKTIAISLHLDPETPEVLADAASLNQALLNLSVNARDAMSGSGRLSFGTESVAGAMLRQRFLDAAAERYVCISITDNGPGIEPVDLERIFEPFFTTKINGKGSGLGLSVSYGIVRDHHGFIDVESEVGRGTMFRIFLPVHSPNALAEVAAR